MQTLGVSGPEHREDNFFQRLFWPTIHNQYDVDLAARRGFWLSLVVGVISALVLLVQGSLLIALLTLATFLLGAAGIRQRSLPAGILVTCIYTLGVVLQWLLAIFGPAHAGNPLVSLVCIALLLSCVRAASLSRQFAEIGDVEFPSEGPRGVASQLSNRFPRAVWPKLRILFFVLAGLYLVLTVLGGAGLLIMAKRAPASVIQVGQ